MTFYTLDGIPFRNFVKTQPGGNCVVVPFNNIYFRAVFAHYVATYVCHVSTSNIKNGFSLG